MIERRLASLDLLRGLAAAVVALSHFCVFKGWFSTYFQTASSLAVEVFFVLSGFVLTPQLLYCLSTGQKRDLGIFLIRRWMRTVPPYLFALLAITFMLAKFGSQEFVPYVFYVQNLFSAPSDDYFPVAWSLSVEEWAYLTFAALIALFVSTRLFPQKLFLIVAVVIVFCASLRYFFPHNADWGPEIRRVVVFRLDAVASGVLLRLISDRFRPAEILRPVFWGGIWVASLVAAAAITFAAGIFSNDVAKVLFPYTAALFGSVCILGLLSLDSRLPERVAFFSDHVGKLSYSLYLFHLIFIMLVARLLSPLSPLEQLIAYSILTVGFCFTFYSAIERPILAARPPYKALAKRTAARAAIQEGLLLASSHASGQAVQGLD